MKLIKFLHSLNNASDKRKLLCLYIVAIDRKIKYIDLEYLTSKFKISNQQLLLFFKELPEIFIEKYSLKFEVKGTKIYPIWSKIKARVELTAQKKAFIENVLNTLNEITGKRYRYSSEKNRTVISARMKEGYTFEDFVYVIQVQSMKWLGTDSEMYLRPETIFGNKMDGYLNSPMPKTSKNQSKLQRINDAINSASNIDWENLSGNS